MAKAKKIAVTTHARGVVDDMRNYDHGAPDRDEMRAASGVAVGTEAPEYVKRMRTGGSGLWAKFSVLLEELDTDLKDSQASIDDMLGLDADVARALKDASSEVTNAPAPGKKGTV